MFRLLTALPEQDRTTVKLSRLSRWTLIDRIQQDFWKRWRTKVHPGMLVLINQDHFPPCQRPLERITALNPGPDSVSRVADVHTTSGVIRRPLIKLFSLPTQKSLKPSLQGGQNI